MTIADLGSESLTNQQWEIAHAIAQTLVKEETDFNELGKAIAYLRSIVNQTNASVKFFTYLKTLVRDGKQIGHSGKTFGYYRTIEATCSDYLQKADAQIILQILGWVYRLMRYYKDGGVPIGEIAPPTAFTVESARQQEIAKAIGNRNFAVGEIVEAIVSAIKSIEVTYEIVVTKQRLSKKEHKKAKLLKIGQKVKVEILEIKEDGSIKKIRLIE
jgi:hypothetical protein